MVWFLRVESPWSVVQEEVETLAILLIIIVEQDGEEVFLVLNALIIEVSTNS